MKAAAGKRSAAAAPLALLLLTLLAGCGGPSQLDVIESLWRPVATLTEPAEHTAGVHRYPLAVGDRLLFWFGDRVTPSWTMQGVSYSLRLIALDSAGDALDSLTMAACPSDASCPVYRLPVKAAGWIEERTY